MRLIDADELRKQMYHEAFETDTDMQRWDGGCWIRYKMFENAIESAPTVDPVQHGRWIQHGVGHENVPWGFDCSECAEWFVIDRQYITRYRYCPNCGAKMDEVREDV